MSVLMSNEHTRSSGAHSDEYIPGRITSFVVNCVKSMPQAVSSMFFEPADRSFGTVEREAIAGQWTCKDWGIVIVHPSGTATYSNTHSSEPGLMKLGRAKNGRFSGLWWEAGSHGGKISIQPIDDNSLEVHWTCTFRDVENDDSHGQSVWTRR